jgi:hypothetical protein
MPPLSISDFPSATGLVRAQWAPILLRPILGSPEQLVIGVAAVNSTAFHLERANCFDRLQCFFSGDAAAAVIAAEASLDGLANDLATRSGIALVQFEPLFSSVYIGELQEGEGPSLESIASSWMMALSSLYTASPETEAQFIASGVALETGERTAPADRLPSLVLDYVSRRRPGLSEFFNPAIRDNIAARRGNISRVIIDYAGSHLVANFGTLTVHSHAVSVDRIKRRLWDLKVARDQETGPLIHRLHELFVQHPLQSDPQFGPRQLGRIAESVETLSEQARQEEIQFSPLHTVEQIGDHVLQREAV